MSVFLFSLSLNSLALQAFSVAEGTEEGKGGGFMIKKALWIQEVAVLEGSWRCREQSGES